jgi:signal peptidase II
MIRDAILFTTIITADRITKVIVPYFMDLHQSIPVIPNLFNFTYVKNTGGAFGILASWDSPMRRGFFIIASLAAIVLLWFLYRQAASSSSRMLRISLASIGGGAFGNLYDRAVSGGVVDFLDFYIGSYHWPAFNIADSAISVGAVLLAYCYFTGEAEMLNGRQDPDVS